MNNPHQPVGRWIAPVRRLAIYLRDGYACLLCGKDLTSCAPRDITLDHHVPRCMGGSNESSNLYTACRDCNQKHKHEKRTWKQRRRIMVKLNTSMTPFLDAAAVLVAWKKQRYDVS